MIRFILFIHRDSGSEGRVLENAVRDRFQAVHREVCPDVASLRKALTLPSPYGDLTAIVLLTETPERLEELDQVFDHLEGKKLLLILPDMEKSSFVAAFRMRPRYITQRSKTFSDVCDVLEKMLENHNRP